MGPLLGSVAMITLSFGRQLLSSHPKGGTPSNLGSGTHQWQVSTGQQEPGEGGARLPQSQLLLNAPDLLHVFLPPVFHCPHLAPAESFLFLWLLTAFLENPRWWWWWGPTALLGSSHPGPALLAMLTPLDCLRHQLCSPGSRQPPANVFLQCTVQR